MAQRKYATAQKLADEGQHFLILSRKLENGGEVAHSDVIKAQLQFNQQSRDLQQSQLTMDRARLDLAVLVFPDFNQNFSTVDDLQSLEPLAPLEEVRAAARTQEPRPPRGPGIAGCRQGQRLCRLGRDATQPGTRLFLWHRCCPLRHPRDRPRQSRQSRPIQ